MFTYKLITYVRTKNHENNNMSIVVTMHDISLNKNFYSRGYRFEPATSGLRAHTKQFTRMYRKQYIGT